MFDEYKFPPGKQDGFREAVSIEAMRIFDTCSERDCITDLAVTLDEGSTLTDTMTVVKTRCAEVSGVCISIDSVPFKKGCYAVDITYTFRLSMDAYERACADNPTPLEGTAVWNKRVILYGSKGSFKTFDSDDNVSGETDSCCRIYTKPKVTVSVVEPIALETKIDCYAPAPVNCDAVATVRGILVTLGLFSVVRIMRPVSILVPTYDYCIPDKECCVSAESPREIFGRLEFPSDEFFPGACRAPAADIPPTECRTERTDFDYMPENTDINE